MPDIIQGFEPIFDVNSKVLILGSFPSVKSRLINFYYGNRQNRFWKMLCGYFGDSVPDNDVAKKKFLKAHAIALWDVVSECEIIGSSDSKIRNYKIVDLSKITGNCVLKTILLNGTTAYRIFCERYRDIDIPFYLMPSTSPANVRYKEGLWIEKFNTIFKGEL